MAVATKTFRQGIHPPHRKKATEGKPIERIPFAPVLLVPLSQHIGAPARAIVEKKQAVVRGEKIAEPGGFVSVAMHAPATGTVTKIASVLDARGVMTPAIHIKVDPEADQGEPAVTAVDVDALPAEGLIEAVQQAGLVGLGGAAFPTHVKLNVPNGKKVDTVIANGCECEPYLTTDHRVMLEQASSVLEGLEMARRATGAERAIVGVEINKPDAIEALRAAVPPGAPVTVEAVKVKYPQGAEKMLVTVLLGREIPSGGLPADAGVGVFNVATLAQMAHLVPRGQGLIERVITVTGSGVARPGNYLTPQGTPVGFLLEHAGMTERARMVVLGGPMMGPSAPSLEVPLTKGVSGVLVLTDDEIDERAVKVFPCIRCGQCLSACPIRLNPSRLGLLARSREYAVMEESYHLNDCFECGSCTYVCPSNLPLVQYFRMAKVANRERKAKS